MKLTLVENARNLKISVLSITKNIVSAQCSRSSKGLLKFPIKEEQNTIYLFCFFRYFRLDSPSPFLSHHINFFLFFSIRELFSINCFIKYWQSFINLFKVGMSHRISKDWFLHLFFMDNRFSQSSLRRLEKLCSTTDKFPINSSRISNNTLMFEYKSFCWLRKRHHNIWWCSFKCMYLAFMLRLT